MEADVEGQIGVSLHERTGERTLGETGIANARSIPDWSR